MVLCKNNIIQLEPAVFVLVCSYGLLGSSGCGKTTLLRCILGRLELSEGHIDVLGRPPGSKGHTIPGRDVGYMPQVFIFLR